jgi:DNA recombination protein RmuC
MELAVILLSLALVAVAIILAFVLIRPKPVPEPAKPDPRLDAVISGQGAIQGRFQEAIESQAALQRTLAERLEALDQRLGENLKENSAKTSETLGGIQARLTVIDEAQKNISALSGQVTSLQQIFSDKQQRGAFAQERMEAIVADHFPPGHYDFQFTLSNGKRPDCVIRIPNVPGAVVIDAKFPLEAFEAMRTAADEDARKPAMARLRTDVQKHVKDIAEKYLLPGETQAPAIMFVPSESIYAELHLSFAELIQAARRQQVMIMSPHVFLLALGTIQALMRDAKMREQAHRIQQEVGELLQDVKRLAERIGDLRKHFDTTNKDIGQIEISMKRIGSRASRIELVELGGEEAAPLPLAKAARPDLLQ